MDILLYVALAVVPTTYLVRLLLFPLIQRLDALYVSHSLLALLVTAAIGWSALDGDPLRMGAAWGLSHVIQRTTRFLEASGDARRAETVRAARRRL